MYFAQYQKDVCCLCGSSDSLSGEHKIKASALRRIFGSDAMVIGGFGGDSPFRSAQGPKSKKFHFNARMCALCNGERTQPADKEFDRFHSKASAYLEASVDPGFVFSLPEYAEGSAAYLNVFRYFSKLLCCHIAESEGPRLLEACEFAIGRSTRNLVSLGMDADPTYEDYRRVHGSHKYASHGGLVVPVDENSREPTSFRSSLTLGPVRYVFCVRFGWAVGDELRMDHQDFWKKCQEAYTDAVDNPMSDEARRRLGL